MTAMQLTIGSFMPEYFYLFIYLFISEKLGLAVPN
jgi:hypothetical protein